ncbi:MAG: PHP domain-containing protein, partial [Candidatus Dormibacteraeota bacterium]|nr:PHP domain-containing protein [Candidatus Dormibacteraeota bacterium]
MSFAELAARSHYSFLEGAASPKAMVVAAARLGIEALGLCDRNGLYGAVELTHAAAEAGIRPIVGTELELSDGSRLRLLAIDHRGYRQLCRAVSWAQLAGVKGQVRVRLAAVSDDLPHTSLKEGETRPRRRPTLPPPERPAALRPTAGPFPSGWPGLPSTTLLASGEPAALEPADLDRCVALAGGPRSVLVEALLRGDRRGALRHLGRLRDCFGADRACVLLTDHLHPADTWLVEELAAVAARAGLPVLASATPDHATRADKPLLDVLTAIRHRTTLDNAAAHGLLLPNSEHRLQTEQVLRSRLRHHPDAFDTVARIAAMCSVSLDFSDVRFPGFPVPRGETPFSMLYGL